MAYVPPGWPPEVRPPGSEDFETTALAWLFDVSPPDFWSHAILRRYPAALVYMARVHAESSADGARNGYRKVRTELSESVPPQGIAAVLVAYTKEGARLVAIAMAVRLVERALRGEIFEPKLLPTAINGR